RGGTWGSAVEEAPAAGPTLRGATARAAESVDLLGVDGDAPTRFPSGEPEVDRVLGGGIVSGSAVLLTGEPGIGKSTLLLQLAAAAAARGDDVLYVAGEESPLQVRLRADRLGVGEGLKLTRQTFAPAVASYLAEKRPRLAIVDSIQTLTHEEGAVPGTVTQVRDGTALLVTAAKQAGTALVLIGHVTKQGTVAGPKVVEHMVDVTLSLESAGDMRVLRSAKNRFGATGEVGVFEMTHGGLSAVPNPSAAFLAERPVGAPGSVVAAVLEGQRPLLLEVQALASKSPYSAPRRAVQGLDQRRLDPGTDLAFAVAIYPAVTNRPVDDVTALVGEVGLAGELRSVSQLGRRLQEASRAGFDRVIGPRSAEAVVGVGTLKEALA